MAESTTLNTFDEAARRLVASERVVRALARRPVLRPRRFGRVLLSDGLVGDLAVAPEARCRRGAVPMPGPGEIGRRTRTGATG